jgi:putative methanogenesis marker protein 6
MNPYQPSYQGTVTKYVFVESPHTTPDDLASLAYEISDRAMIKETCFGLQITGNEDDVETIITKLRARDPAHIFVKDRGFPPGDPRRCRANLGGARPGYFGHEFEMGIVRKISKGILNLATRDPGKKAIPPVSRSDLKLDATELARMMEKEVP